MPFFTVDGARLHYREAGEGERVVVLLHAFPLHSGMWQRQLDAFAAHRRVVAPDLRGFGQSVAPEDRDEYTMARYADDVAALLIHLGVSRAVVGGVSMGGYASFAFVTRYPEVVCGLILADTRAAADSPEVLERRTRQQEQVAREGTGPVIEAQLETLLSPRTREQRPEIVEEVRALMDNPAAGFIGGLEAMKKRADVTADLPNISVPTLVLVGEHDVPSPPDVAQAMAEQLPDARFELLPDAGHLSNIEAADAFNAAAAAFLRER